MFTFAAASDHNVHRACGASSPLEDITQLLADAQQAIGRDHDTAKDCLARASALLRSSEARRNSTRAETHKGGLAAWQAKRVCAYIDSNLSGRILACDLATTVSLSTSHFFRVFRETFGMTPLTFVAKRRIQNAQEMMLASNEPLAQVAIACGLCDQAHLTRMFRRVVGSTPRDWRQQHCVTRNAPRTSAACCGG